MEVQVLPLDEHTFRRSREVEINKASASAGGLEFINWYIDCAWLDTGFATHNQAQFSVVQVESGGVR